MRIFKTFYSNQYLILLIAFCLFIVSESTIAQTIGSYPNITVNSGQSTTVAPVGVPANITSIVAFANNGFEGLLSVNPASGVVTITNALQAGTFTVTVKAFNGSLAISNNFSLVVKNSTCSQANFTIVGQADIGFQSYSAPVGDFNGDGILDIAATSFQASTVAIRLGNGEGGFTGTNNVAVGTGPFSVVIGEFNGDGNLDLATANNVANTVSVRLGNGAGGFTGLVEVPVGIAPGFVETGDFNSDGRQDLCVVNIVSSSVSILSGDGAGGFVVTKEVLVAAMPRSLAIGDFNGDAKLDIAVTIQGVKKISILIGDGMGGFSKADDLLLESDPWSIAIADFNNDTHADLAVTNYASNSVSILSGNGSGGFIPANSFSVGIGPRSIAVGDFNGDGILDLAVPNTGSNTVSVRLGNGSGVFSGTNNEYVGESPRTIAIGDFNGDGRLDIATALSTSFKLSVLLADYSMNASGNNIVIKAGDTSPDVNDHTDFGMVYVGSKSVRNYTIANTSSVPFVVTGIFLRGGDSAMFSISSLNPSATIPVGGSAKFTTSFSPVSGGIKSTSLHIVGENCPEAYYDYVIQGTGLPLPELGIYPDKTIIAGQNATVTPNVPPTNTTSIIASTNTGFSGVLTVNPVSGMVTITNAKQAGFYRVALQSFNAGGSDTTSFLLIVKNPDCSQGTFTSVTPVNTGTNPFSVAVADFNSDGNQDILVANKFNSNYSTISIRMGNGMGGFNGNTDLPVGINPAFVAVSDLNGDGHQDIIVANETTNNVSILIGNGSGGFNNPVHLAVGQNPNSISVGDFNKDGHKDLAVGLLGQNSITILLGNGSGGFILNAIIHDTGSRPRSIASGDFNSDGIMDILTANNNSNSVSILLGNGLGGFTKTIEIPVGAEPISVAVGDFDNDGKQDFATANYASHQVSIRKGDGLGGFSGSTEVPVGTAPAGIAIGDFNGDGNQDFATVSFLGNTTSIRLGNGSLVFTGTTNFPVGNNPTSLAIGDFNADGKFDIATTNIGNNTGNVSILLGEASGISHNTWLGITADWNTPTNWSTGLVPSACTPVIVNANVPNMPTVSGINNTCFTLMLGNGATVNMAPGAVLNITGK